MSGQVGRAFLPHFEHQRKSRQQQDDQRGEARALAVKCTGECRYERMAEESRGGVGQAARSLDEFEIPGRRDFEWD